MTARFALVVAGLVAGCVSPPVPGGRPGGEPGLRLVEVPAALDVVQVGGGADVDYIIDSLGAGAGWLDYDLDGDFDLYVAQGSTRMRKTGPADRLYRNDGDGRFTDVTKGSGLGDTAWSFGVSVADFDADGDPDIYLTNWGANRLYRNDGEGRFTDVARQAGVDDPGWSSAAAWSDVDGDGDLDLYVVNYVEFTFDRYRARGKAGVRGEPPCSWRGLSVFCGPRGLEPGRDVFFRNDGDTDGDGVPDFVDATIKAGLVPPEDSYGLAVRFFDADADGDPDLYVANDSLLNAFFINVGKGKFRESSVISGLAYNEQGHEQAGMGIAVGDYDGDGAFDLAVANFSHDHDTLYRNEGAGMFMDVSYPSGLAPDSYYALAWGIEFADLDQDGRLDLVVARGHVYPQVEQRDLGTHFAQPNGYFRNLGRGVFEPIAAPPSSVACSRSLLPADIDGDGDLDLLFTNLNAKPSLVRNDSSGGHWLQIRLRGAGANRDGIGAFVAVEARGGRQVREMTRSASFAGSIPPVVHFGLGPDVAVDRAIVRWPSGKESIVENVAVDRMITIVEGEQP